MSFGLTMAGLSSALLPALIGAAGGAGIGALTSEDGFSDDGWWKGAIGGGLLGGIGGGMGMFSPAGAVTGPSSPLISGASMPGASSGGLEGFMGSLSNAPVTGLGSSPLISGAAMPAATTPSVMSMLNPSLLTAGGGIDPNFFSMGNLGNMMPGKDTLTKGLLASKVFGALSPDKKKDEPYMSPARISPISRPGAHSPLPYRMGGGFMGGGQRGSTLGSRRY